MLAPTRRAIQADHRTAAQAWQGAIETMAGVWEAIEDPYLRARADDLRSVGAQVLAQILGIEPPAPALEAPGILLAADLTPADTSGLDPAVVMGIATARGGPTSHAAVLARSMGIPAVVGLGDRLMEIEDGTTLALDGDRGLVHVDPSAELLTDVEEARTVATMAADAARAAANTPAVTADGETIEVSANVGTPEEVAPAVAAGADGVGLFRTEFLFMDRDAMPTEDEQEAAYRLAAEALHGRPLLLRTLDAGADKPLPYLGQAPEPNPFLGVRGVRLGLARPDLLLPQLRAVASGGGRVPGPRDVPHGVHGRRTPPRARTAGGGSPGRGARHGARDRHHGGGARRSAHRAGPGSLRRLLLDRHERPHAVRTRRRSRQRTCGGTVGRLTPSRAAARRGHDHRRAAHMVVGSASAANSRARPRATPLLLGLGVRELSMSAPAIARGQAGRAQHRHRRGRGRSPPRRSHARPRPRSARCWPSERPLLRCAAMPG